MKTKALLISTLCLLGANYSWAADEDVTPGHLKFADQAVGSYEFVFGPEYRPSTVILVCWVKSNASVSE